MATKRWYLNASSPPALSDTAVTAADLTHSGWVVGTGATFSSELSAGQSDRAATTFVANTVPDGTLDFALNDYLRTVSILNGTFASGSWTFQFTVVSPTQGGAADGQIVFRLIRADANGANAVEITSAQQSASVCTNVGSTDLGTSANVGTLTFNPGAFTITNQYLFIQIAWKRTGAGGMTSTNIRFRTGSSTTVGTSILSADYTPATQAVTGATIPSLAYVEQGTPYVLPPVGAILHFGLSSSAPTSDLSQTFRGHGGTLSQIDLDFRQDTVSAPTGNVYIELRQDTFTGTVLATSQQVGTSLIGTTQGTVSFTFTPVVLDPTKTYWIRVYRTTNVGVYRLYTRDGNAYPQGEIRISDGTEYATPGYDLIHTLYLTPGWIVSPSQVVIGSTITTGSALFVPTVVALGAAQTIGGVTRTSAAQLYGPTVSFPSGGGPPFVKTVTIDHTQVGGANLTDFPVTIAVTDVDFKTIANGGYVSSSSGYDIRPFADLACTTALDFELVEYDSATGWIELHVKLPSVSYTVDTVFYLSVGNVTFTTNGSNGTNTFSNGYVSVFHLKTLGLVDSLIRNTAYFVGTGVSAIPAILGGGIALDGSAGSYANVWTDSMPSKFPCTVSAWATDVGSLIFTRWDARGAGNYDWYFAAGRFICQVYAGDHGDAIASPTPSSGWHWYAGRFGGGYLVESVQLFVDGNWSADGTNLFAYETSGVAAGVIGGQVNADGSVAPGGALNIDELRIANVSRSDGWLYAEYHNQVTGSTFLTITAISGGGGGDQTIAGATIASTAQFFGPTVVIAPLTVITAFIESGVGPRVTDTFDLVFIGPALISVGMFPPTVVALTYLDITGGTIASGNQRFSPTVAPGPVSVTLGTVTATSQVFVPSPITVGPVTILGATRVTTSQLFAPTLTALTTGATIASTSQVFAPSIAYAVTLGTRAPALQLNAPTVAVTVTTGTITTGNQRFVLSVATGPVTVVGATIGAGDQQFVLTIVPGPVTVVCGFITGATVTFVPSVSVGPVTVTGATIAPTNQLYLPALTAIAFGAIGAESIPTTVVMRPPTVALATFFVVGATIPSASVASAPSVAYVVTGAFKGSTLVLNPPSLLTITSVIGSSIGSTLQLTAPSLAQVSLVTGATIGPNTVMLPPFMITSTATGSTISTTTNLFPPSVLSLWFVTGMHIPAVGTRNPPSVAAVVTFTSISATTQLFAPSLIAVVSTASISSTLQVSPLTVSADVVGATIAPTSQLFAPTVFVVPAGAVTGVTILSTLQVYAPAIFPQVGFISSTVTLYGPNVSPVIGIIVVGGIAPTTELFPPAVARVFPPTTCVASQILVRYLVTSATLECEVVAEASIQVVYLGWGMIVDVDPVVASGIQVRYLAASAGVHVCCAEVNPCESC